MLVMFSEEDGFCDVTDYKPEGKRDKALPLGPCSRAQNFIHASVTTHCPNIPMLSHWELHFNVTSREDEPI